jgi:hypothetical protein
MTILADRTHGILHPFAFGSVGHFHGVPYTDTRTNVVIALVHVAVATTGCTVIRIGKRTVPVPFILLQAHQDTVF